MPSLIRERPRWVLFTRETRNGGPAKTPRCVDDPSAYAAVNDPSTFGSFDNAVAAHARGHCDAIGYALGDGVVGVDLDKCRDPKTGIFTPKAREIIDAIDSYSEVSWSQNGGHILAMASGLPGTRRRKGGIEIYPENRFFVVTGHHLDGTPATIEERTAELGQVYRDVFGDDDEHRDDARHEHPQHDVHLDDQQLLERARDAKDGARFTALYDGDVSRYGSRSEADLALCNHLAFWTGCDADRINRLFRQSGLMRPKWTSRRRESTYGLDTIRRAIADCRNVYSGAGGMPDLHLGEDPVDIPVPEPTLEPVYTIVTPRDSFVTRYVTHMCQRTDAPPEAHELMAVGILSACAGPRPTIPMATSTRGDRLIEWLCYIQDSTVGRKTTVLGFARDLLKEVLGEAALIEWEGSPQGFIQRQQNRDGEASVFVRDELSGLIAQMNKGGHLSGLSQMLIRSFDGGVLENIRTRKRRATGEMSADTDRVDNPYLVMLTASTWTSFIQRVSIDNVLDGLLSRFTFVTGAADPRPRRTLPKALEGEWTDLVGQAKGYHAAARMVTRLEVDDTVLDLAWELEQDCTRKAIASTSPDAAGPALKRLSEAVLRTSGLLSLENFSAATQTPVIRPEHFAPARTMGDRWVKSTRAEPDPFRWTGYLRR